LQEKASKMPGGAQERLVARMSLKQQWMIHIKTNLVILSEAKDPCNLLASVEILRFTQDDN
jgi:hypothetical protein